MQTKTRTTGGALILLFALAGAAAAQAVLTVDEAAKRIGETVTFEGKVEGVASSPEFKATYVASAGPIRGRSCRCCSPANTSRS